FASGQQRLIEKERQAEVEETTEVLETCQPAALQKKGLAVLNLVVGGTRTGFGGKRYSKVAKDFFLVDLEAMSTTPELPAHGLRTGDIVSIREQLAATARKTTQLAAKSAGIEGVVTRVTEAKLTIALSKEDDEPPTGKLWVVKLANDVTYSRMTHAMRRLEKMSESEQSGLVRVLLGLGKPGPQDKSAVKDLKFLDETLNESQQDAVRFALSTPDIALIHGPPGTGKTYTLIECIRQLVARDLRVLVCGPSNISVDNIVERLSPYRIPMVRLGHPARLLPSVLNHSLDILTRTGDQGVIVGEVRKEMDETLKKVSKTRNGRERRALYGEMKELRKEYRVRERKCVEELVRGSRVVLATLHGAGGYHLAHEKFDVVIIDEVSQSLEAQCWIPLSLRHQPSKLLLFGDHLQLPPTIKTKHAASAGALETTLFDRLLKLHGEGIKKLLNVQYRMHEDIMRYPSDALYEGKLIAGEGVAERLLKDLPEVENTEDTSVPVIFWDTQGDDCPEYAEDTDNPNVKGKGGLLAESKSNENETIIVGRHVKALVEAGVRPEDIAVITPYNAQV
ncbi:P-loop containing nucleoside triphosphate hydrolase protein, partial [Saitoella complicata NRRL Y-17804]|uniref:P-loop containing nucleoside triphosphate hydrolase protein n=1 Tax=Saitoella complicata (strain BCRC 22490 / CBS 7301 / JCM 7358 / NBRC 10748 / NRRL Y-17804) TaxID=698492 RepID=UPI0008680C57